MKTNTLEKFFKIDAAIRRDKSFEHDHSAIIDGVLHLYLKSGLVICVKIKTTKEDE